MSEPTYLTVDGVSFLPGRNRSEMIRIARELKQSRRENLEKWRKFEQRRDEYLRQEIESIKLVKEKIETDEQFCNDLHSFIHKQYFRLHRSRLRGSSR